MPSEDEDRDHGDNFHKLRNTKDCQHTAISQERDVEQIVPHSPQKIDPADSFILDFQPLQLRQHNNSKNFISVLQLINFT